MNKRALHTSRGTSYTIEPHATGVMRFGVGFETGGAHHTLEFLLSVEDTETLSRVLGEAAQVERASEEEQSKDAFKIRSVDGT